MTKQSIIDRTVQIINLLPEEKAIEISQFADFVLKKLEEAYLQKNIEHIIENSTSFNFLNEEEEIYTFNDCKKSY